MDFKGWVTDSLPSESESLSWRDALNILITKGFKSISNDNGFDYIVPSVVGSIIIGVIPIPTGFVLFKNTGGLLEIGTYDGVAYTIRLKTVHLSADINFPIEGVFKYNYKNDLIICWTNNNTQIGLLNLDSLPFVLNGAKELTVPAQIVKSYLFPEYKHPNFSSIEEYDSGGLLPEGIIQVVVRYNISDFDFTSCSLPSNPIPVKQIAHYHESNIGGGLNITTGRIVARTYNAGLISASFKLSLVELDTRYTSFEVILISKTLENISAKIYQSYTVPVGGARDIVITSFTGEDLPVEEVLVPRFTFKTCKTLTTIDNRLVPANIKYVPDLDFQKYVNNIKIKWEAENLASTLTGYDPFNKKFTYASSKVCFLFRGYQPNEVMAFYLHLIMKDGSVSNGYTIPGRVSSGTNSQVVSLANGYDATEVAVDPEGSASGIFKRFHLKDTSTVTTTDAKGAMGFWENSDETYPDTVDFDVWTAAGNIGSIRNQNVRHHRMPDVENLHTLTAANGLYIKVLSISLEDIYIPPAIESQIDGFFISYAKRLSGKTLVEGESKVLSGSRYASTDWYFQDPPRNIDVVRFYDYNLLYNKPSIYPRYIKNLGRITCTVPNSEGITGHLQTKPTTPDRFQVIDNTRYYPIDNSVVRNYHKEECIGLEFPSESAYPIAQVANSPIFNPAVDSGGYHNGIRGFTVQLLNHTYNLYNNFNAQELVYTGKIFRTNGTNNYTVTKLYGGDTFLSLQKFRTVHASGVDDTDNTNDIAYYFDHHTSVYSPMNYNFFFGEENKDLFEFQNSSDATYIIPNAAHPTGDADIKLRPLKYNRVFSAINSLVGLFPFDTYNIFVDSNPFVVTRSSKFQSESKGLNWRDFLVNDYYEMPRNKGEIWKVSTYNKTLIIHQKYSLYTASIKDKLATAGGDTYLGVGDIFDRQPDEQLTSDKGTCGNQSQFASFVCDFGYFSIDLQEGKVFLFDGGSLKELSNKKVRNDLKNQFQAFKGLDNPFVTGGATASYDDKNKRVIISAFNLVSGITIAYSFDAEMWIGRHSYIGNYFFYNRDNTYAVTNSGSSGVYSFNSIGKKAKYYGGVVYDTSIDFVLKAEDTKELIEAIGWNSLVLNGSNVVQKKTFDKIQVYNNLQATPLTTITDNASTGIWFDGNSRELDEMWFFNKLRDCVVNRAIFVHDNRGGVNNSNINSSTVWFQKSNIIANFVIVKLVFSNTSQVDIYLNDIGASFKPKTR